MDFLYRSLERAIKRFYDYEFMGAEVTRNHHLSLLLENYDPARFRDCNDLPEERKKFLTELQGMVEGRSYWGG